MNFACCPLDLGDGGSHITIARSAGAALRGGFCRLELKPCYVERINGDGLNAVVHAICSLPLVSASCALLSPNAHASSTVARTVQSSMLTGTRVLGCQ